MWHTPTSLTLRGRLFVAAGFSIAFTAWFSGQDGLVPVGVLLIALPVLATVSLARMNPDLHLHRTVRPPMIGVGQQGSAELVLTNRSSRPTSVQLIAEAMPDALGSPPRFVVASLGAGDRRVLRYRFVATQRGRHRLGPATVEFSDPYGLVVRRNRFTSFNEVTVTPRVIPLSPLSASGAWAGAGDNRPRSFATGSAEDVTVREYRDGDDLRRVHWRSSARVGALMVRREEQPWHLRATVYLDNREVAHHGQGATSTFERAVEAAASVAAHLLGAGFTVRLVTAFGEHHRPDWHAQERSAQLSGLLEQLAVLTPTRRTEPDARWLSDPERDGLVVAVLGQVVDGDAPFLARLGIRASATLALCLRSQGEDPAAHPLGPGITGWRGVSVLPDDDLGERWAALEAPSTVRGTSPWRPR